MSLPRQYTLFNEPSCSLRRWQANSGGPASRRRTERVRVSLLQDDAGSLRLPRVLRAGLDFGGRHPAQTVFESMARVALDDAEQLRSRFWCASCRTRRGW